MNIVIYARYSSDKQTDQSIEGQLKVCHEFAERNRHAVIREYVDKALTGRSDDRPAFQRMIADSAKKQFEAVLVYSLDRFSRDRYDNAVYKRKLKQNGVRVISTQENITDDPTGKLMESIIEGFAQYYSEELALKVRRGMEVNADNCRYNGGTMPLGFRSENKHLVINEDTAPYVRFIFEMYANGTRAADIAEYLNARQIRTSTGAKFNKNSLHSILKNKKYIGYYTYAGKEIPNGVPRIISDDLFNRVQEILARNKANAGHNKAKAEYLLTTKLFCGDCHSPMVGLSAKSSTGRTYYYYSCNKKLDGNCKMRNKSKEKLERLVLKKAREMLTPKNIEKIAKAISTACEKGQDNYELKRLQAKRKETEKAIGNLLDALEAGQNVDLISERITSKRRELEGLDRDIAIEKTRHILLGEQEIRFFLSQLKKGNINDVKYQRTLIAVLVNAVYVFDDHLTIVFNASDCPVTVDGILLEELEENLGGKNPLDSAACGSPKRSSCRASGGSFALVYSSFFTIHHSFFIQV